LAYREPRDEAKITLIFSIAIPAERDPQLLDSQSKVTPDPLVLRELSAHGQVEWSDLGNS